jgi:hypothetical protein
MFTFADIFGALLATALYLPVIVLPGFALAKVFGAATFLRAPQQTPTLTGALLVGTTVLPVVLASLARAGGLNAAVVACLVLALMGCAVVPSLRTSSIPRHHVALAGAWLVIVVGTWIDVAVGDRLYMSLLTVDMLKHAATTRALVDTGAVPFTDPFFLRDGHASFYYFYFVASALVVKLGGGWVDARMAVAGQVFWTGIALAGLIALIARRSGLLPRIPSPTGLLVFLMAAAGFQM